MRQNVDIKNVQFRVIPSFYGDRQLHFYMKIRHTASAHVEFGASNLNQALQPKTDIFIILSTRVMTLQDFLTSGNYDIQNDPNIEIFNIERENQIHIEPTRGYVRFYKVGQFKFSNFKS